MDAARSGGASAAASSIDAACDSLDKRMSKRLADLRPSQLEEDDSRILSLVTGLTMRGVSRRLNAAHGNSLMSSIFGAEWPEDADSLGPLTVATAMRANLVNEISDATALTRATVRARMAGVEGKKMLLANLFHELSEEEEDEDEDEDEEEDDEETDSDEPLKGRQRFLDETLTFSVTELVGDIRAVSLRRAPALVEWLAARTELSERVLRSRFKKAHGRTLLRTILTDVWPLRVTGPSRGMLADLTTGAVSLSPSLLRWVADVAGLGVRDARRRVEAAHGNTRLARALPELVSGEEADEGEEVEDDEDAEEPNRLPSRAPRAKRISVAPPSTRKRIVSGRYELHGRIGSGHFGTVWEAMRIEHPQDRVVLKVARHAEAGRLREEMLIANRLRHPNICTYLDYGSDPSFGEYLVMDHCGKSLQDILSAGNPLTVEQAIEVVRQAADGLEFAHSRGVLHHDIKPGNILIEARKSDAWDVRVGDFGVSVKGRTGQNTLGAHTVFGTEPVGWTNAYASPELLRGEKAGKRSDQYALGLVFCSMLEGDVFERRYKPRTFGRLSPRQNAAVARALSADAQDRFDSCTAFAAALARS